MPVPAEYVVIAAVDGIHAARQLSSRRHPGAENPVQRRLRPSTDGRRLVGVHTPHIGGTLHRYRREAGRLVGEVLTALSTTVAPGVSTEDLDALAEQRIRAAGAIPAFKGYLGYPATICASINDEVIHGIPSSGRVLQEGDVISIDVGASLDGYYGDSAITLPVGRVSDEAARLLRVTEESLFKAIARDLGPTSQAMILRNHGLLSLGASVSEAFEIMYYLDAACQIQVDAMAGGRIEVGLIDEQTARKGFEQFNGPGGSEVARSWIATLRMLERKGVNYRI